MSNEIGGDALDAFIFAARDQTTRAFDEANQDCLNDTIGSIGKILSTHVILTSSGTHFFGVRFEAFALLKTALDTLVSALHLTRQRANIEVACLLRSALESACTALHISCDSDVYEDYRNDRYHSTSSISAAKTEIPIVGEIWGSLSKAAVHVSRGGHGPKTVRDAVDDASVATVDLHFSMRDALPEQDRVTLILVALAAEIVVWAQELTLFDKDPNRPGWLRVPGTSMTLHSSTGTAAMKLYHQLLSRPLSS